MSYTGLQRNVRMLSVVNVAVKLETRYVLSLDIELRKQICQIFNLLFPREIPEFIQSFEFLYWTV
jgi:hypothetical protein